MDETDTPSTTPVTDPVTGTATGPVTEPANGPISGPEAASAEAARQWAEQRRAAARAQFDTPSWLGPTRTDAPAPAIPSQAEPDHDELVVAPPVPRVGIPDKAHWSEKASPRLVAGTILVLALAGLLVSLVLTVTTQSVGAIVALASCAFVAVIFRGALMGAAVTTVDLTGSVMRVRRGGVEHVINLADPGHIVQLIGTPEQSSWRLQMEAPDGTVVELGPRNVDPAAMPRIVEYYQAVAHREKRVRERRFNR